ncbi:MAG TPA: MBL fold metallo-hydrolase [Terriglobales bacterium]|jgi:L-ascorbate metabolism protein UlaG (beta-lactamase superfamily)|nr:MBL fold metallo-hydrolase [Terriglobales bacterium]
MINVTLRRRARQFSKLVRHSALTRRTGQVRKPVLARNGQLGLTFIGHSSFFVQIAGRNLIIDPNFARWLFVLKRLRRPGLMIRDLPALDLVLVTHAHFDHLHRASLRALVRHTQRLHRPAPAIVIPRNVADLVSDLGFREIIELDLWSEYEHDGVSIVHTPSRHWGARIVRDMHRGFGGYVIRSRRESLYHAGDTAYFEGFREIGERLRPDVAMLPIGAYDPPSFRNVHTSPADAVRAFLDLRARYMVPMHYGTFRLSHEPMDEPLHFLASEAKKHGIEEKVLVLQEGVTQVFE